MRTRNSYFPNNSNVTILRRRNKGRAPNIVEPELRTIVAPMAERTMEELLRAPTEGYNQASTLGTLSSNTIPNPKGEMKAITTQSGVAYEGPSIPTNHSPKKVVERETEEATDKKQSNFQGKKSRDKASNQKEKIFQMFQDLRFDISFADALLLMPRFAPTIKSLLMNKEKLLELAKIP
ncbi:hypothetical protein Tco_1025457, partial [Tanacetum coccineum]